MSTKTQREGDEARAAHHEPLRIKLDARARDRLASAGETIVKISNFDLAEIGEELEVGDVVIVRYALEMWRAEVRLAKKRPYWLELLIRAIERVD